MMPPAVAHPPTPRPTDDAAADLLDLADVGRVLRGRWRRIGLATLLGVLAAVAVLAWWPPRFDGTASVVVRSAQDPSSSLLGRLGIPSEVAPAALGNAIKSPLETELQVLASQAVLGAVSDSLGLQARVLSPRGIAPWRLVRPAVYPGSFRRRTVGFERSAGGYRVSGPGVDGLVAPGRPLVTAFGTITLADGPLPERFSIQFLDREDALRRLGDHVDVAKAGGEVIRVGYAAPDSLSAAAVPNAIVGKYLERRKTSDRSINAYRAEFLGAQLDTANAQLAASERALRAFQEGRGGVIDPEVVGKLELEGASKAREELAANEVESGALDSLLRQVTEGRASARSLAGYPTLLKSPAINEIVSQLAKTEADRTRLLERYTPADPGIVALTQSLEGLEHQLEPLGRAYAASLDRQRRSLAARVAEFDAQIATLPASAQTYIRLQRDVKRLTQTTLALQTQLLDARLAAVGEGGETRSLDVAIVPKRPKFPRPIPTLATGVGGGLLLGTLVVLLVGLLSPRVTGATDAARATGLPVAELGRGSALFHAVVHAADGLAVVPIAAGADADAVARWLATVPDAAPVPTPFTLAERNRALVSAADGRGVSAPADGENGVRPVAVPLLLPSVLPPLATPDGVAAVSRAERVVLVASRGTLRRELADAVAAVRLRGAEAVGVVLT